MMLREQTAAFDGDAFSLHWKCRPPDPGNTSFGIERNAAITDFGVTAPVRFLVATFSAPRLENTMSGTASFGSTCVDAYLSSTAWYWRIEASLSSPCGAIAAMTMPFSREPGTALRMAS